jgi:hypothetical protein
MNRRTNFTDADPAFASPVAATANAEPVVCGKCSRNAETGSSKTSAANCSEQCPQGQLVANRRQRRNSRKSFTGNVSAGCSRIVGYAEAEH